MSSVRSQDRN